MKEIVECPTFRPTEEEFTNFLEYIQKIESQCAGMCKIIPPPNWRPRKDMTYAEINNPSYTIKTPIRQYLSGAKGIYQALNVIEKKELSIADFKKEAERMESKKGNNKDDIEKLERFFWKNITFNASLYGADMLGSFFDDDVEDWNLKRLKSILDIVNIDLPGITTPYLYYGMYKSMFACHKEDLDLYSINYLHFGQPKVWYTVAPKDAARFEAFAIAHFPELNKECNQFLRHKTTMISPTILAAANITVTKAIQGPNEFVITLPTAYHFGWNSGFNCAEAVNFATERWIGIGLKAKPCKCESDTVRIDMPAFAAAYEAYKRGEPFPQPAATASPSTASTASSAATPSKRTKSKAANETSPTKRQKPSTITNSLTNRRRQDVEWVFSCFCGEHEGITNADDPSLHPTGRMFECSGCGRWGHIDCYKKYTKYAEKTLPREMYCKRCSAPSSSEPTTQHTRKTPRSVPSTKNDPTEIPTR